MNVSRETEEKLHRFTDLVLKWTKSINLIAPVSAGNIWDRHIRDSAQVIDLAPENWSSWVDLGSGGGFPGIVIAIIDPRRRPIDLVESDTRKALFLTTARRELDLNITVHKCRIEDVTLPPRDVVSARALSSLPVLINYAHRLMGPDGVAIFPKGRTYQEELDDAQQHWHFDVESVPSKTSPDSKLLRLSRISHREP